MPNLSLPLPSSEAAIHSQRLTSYIVQVINEANGTIPFAEFMALALYAPGLGYYSSGARKFGASGDFVTAPEISPLFSQCLARQCQQVLAQLNHGVILEFGAGSGIMATDILKELARLDCLPAQYLILEVSAELQQRQQVTLQARVPELVERVQWLSSLPAQPISGVILANEVLDAMPVQRFCLEEQDLLEFYVGHDGSQFVWQLLPSRNEELRQAVAALRPSLSVPYVSEVNLTMTGWLHSVAERLETGLLLLCDYGFPRREYYHPQRDQGTLMCHYQHYAHTDPLILVGLQDLTAHVDFTAVASVAQSAGLQVAGYTTQANFLLACGLPDLLSGYINDSNYWRLAQQVKTLILPSEMGELFKVMALTRQLEMPLLGWAQDERGRL
jgi:SAM-dependent MidA family methyltransferase